MKRLKKINLFNTSIVILLSFFTIIQVFSFAQIKTIYVSALSGELVIYIGTSFALLAAIIIVLYILPILLVIELSTLFIELKAINNFKTTCNDYIKKAEQVIIEVNSVIKLNVVRC